jgi:hypothetical protein
MDFKKQDSSLKFQIVDNSGTKGSSYSISNYGAL